MARLLSRLDQLAFADLVEKAHDAAFEAEFPANGALLKQERNGRFYWYYRGYERPLDGSPGMQTLKYVGPAGDPNIERRVAAFASLRTDFRARRELAARLRRASLPAPLPFDGAVLAGLASAGLFRLRAVLVGSTAFQTYSGLIGVRLAGALHTTEDIDVAQDYGISVALDDHTAPIEAALQKVDSTFAPIEKWSDPGIPVGFRNARGFKVKFLTTSRGDPAQGDKSSLLAALSVGAQALTFLDYLIRDPVPSVALHDAGVAVVVPSPARYTAHKLIVATRRRQLAKVGKDIDQAAALIDAYFAANRQADLHDAFEEAAARGPAWSAALIAGLERLPAELASAKAELEKVVRDA